MNNEEGLKKTLNSVVQQKYPRLEYIVIDGGSTDATLDVIRTHAGQIARWFSGKDEGIYDAMNKGAAAASGDYVLFLNAGDVFSKSTSLAQLVEQVAAMKSRPDVIYGNHRTVNARRANGLQEARDIKRIVFGMVCSHQSMLFSRARLLKEPFSLRFGTAGDYELLCRWFSQGASFEKQNVAVAVYSGGGISDARRVDSLRDGYRAVCAHLNVGVLVKAVFAAKVLYAVLVGWGVVGLGLLGRMRKRQAVVE